MTGLALDALEATRGFFAAGGPVLLLIAALTLALWMLLLERAWFYHTAYRRLAADTVARWLARAERSSWHARAIRAKFISQTRLEIDRNLSLIRVLIALCPLFGLLGTVTGMIEVFTALAVTAGGDARSMAEGVSRATLPTMAGMVAALSGVLANSYISGKAARERERIAEQLVLD